MAQASRWPKMASRWPQDCPKITLQRAELINQPRSQPSPTFQTSKMASKKHPRCIPKANTNMHVCMLVSWGLSWAQGLLQYDLDDPKLAHMTYMIASRSLPNAPRWPPKPSRPSAMRRALQIPMQAPYRPHSISSISRSREATNRKQYFRKPCNEKTLVESGTVDGQWPRQMREQSSTIAINQGQVQCEGLYKSQCKPNIDSTQSPVSQDHVKLPIESNTLESPVRKKRLLRVAL